MVGRPQLIVFLHKVVLFFPQLFCFCFLSFEQLLNVLLFTQRFGIIFDNKFFIRVTHSQHLFIGADHGLVIVYEDSLPLLDTLDFALLFAIERLEMRALVVPPDTPHLATDSGQLSQSFFFLLIPLNEPIKVVSSLNRII